MAPAVAGDAGSVARCPRCAAVWVTRPDDGPRTAPPPMVRQGARIIEGDTAPAGRGGRRWWAFGRAGLAATLAVLALAVAVVVTQSPDVAARPDPAQDEARR